MMACCLRNKRRMKGKLSWKSKKRDLSHSGNWAPEDDNDEGKIVFFGGSNYTFDLDDLLAASAEILGKGAHVTTYKVAVEDTATVVVKRLEEVVVGRREFEQQMEIVGRIRHDNVAELKAYYYSKIDKLAVYSYYSQGNLFEMLHGKLSFCIPLSMLLWYAVSKTNNSTFAGESQVPLDWESRLRIAIGAARGLAIIHEADDGKFVHGNIKSSNIFTNSKCYGCICDLGLTHITKSLPQTTLRSSGYHAPEITDTRKSTQFSDVYSFGVVLLELLTGKSPASPLSLDENMDLASWIRSVVSKEWTGEVFDNELMMQMGIEEELVEMLQIGLACVALKPQDRPHITHIVKLIQDIPTNFNL
ncbi:Protein kinase superfamily protein [Arabidopsis thaliana]|uniref:Probably inactive receptor-like protein kinase At5g41680 n=1 Tax=Arabidopsis thaliana TaxID=3702 RepID=Y5168_ARATH|nr:Protein kinase superfamily protein [Arabidopsis thaliana]Q3E8J4.1 RecName: Full=Probably inactive receptor-like protein kinase At5g41680 [Arabidopsis thaliana]AED94707.1 Protein kinase superfamily protein [Arabidopsis thaliana]|eukprot:NP_198983.2 Protein kinase superfamily protein [Arabidopsis thaliana]